MKKIILGLVIAVVILIAFNQFALAATLQPFQGGTGFSTTSASNVGSFLQVATTSPFLGYTFGTPAGNVNYWTLSGTSLYPTSTAYSVGIGTTTPAYKLDVAGDGRVTTNFTIGTLTGLLSGSSGLVGTTIINSPLFFSSGTFYITTSSASTSGFLTSTDWNTFNNKQATISAGSNIVLTGASVAVTSTPSVTSVIFPDSTFQSTAYKDFAVNITNASTTTSAATSTTIQKQFFQNITIAQISCSTDGASVTITADRRASSTPQLAGTTMLSSLVCTNTGTASSTISTSTIPALGILNFGISSVGNSTTTLRIYGKYQ